MERTVKGKRPVFLTGDTDANMNRLLTMLSALCAEVAVIRDRQRTLEQVLAGKKTLTLEEIDAFEPEMADLRERLEWQEGFIRRTHRALESADASG